MTPSIVVLYHGPACVDGFASAWAAWKKFRDRAVYIPVNYGEDPPEEARHAAKLYILDFSYPRDVLLELAEGREVLVLDHHASAQQALAGLPFARFDMEKSGSVLAWEHFHPGEPVPTLLRFIQDRDLWRWQMLRSREASACIATVPKDFLAWVDLANAFENPAGRGPLLDIGHGILKYQAQAIERILRNAATATIGGHLVPVVNSPILESELGEALCLAHPEAPFAGVFWLKADGVTEKWSLRSRNGFDVSEVAKLYGGGGHRAAAGFERPAGHLDDVAQRPIDRLTEADIDALAEYAAVAVDDRVIQGQDGFLGLIEKFRVLLRKYYRIAEGR